MSTTKTNDWYKANQRYLMAALNVVHQELKNALSQVRPEATYNPAAYAAAQEALKTAKAALPEPSSLDTVTSVFKLSVFEQKLLLLCAGVELDAHFSETVTLLHGKPALVHPTFGLAMAALPDAHWSAITPDVPLRYWQLIHISPESILVASPLRIDEYVLHFLTGVRCMDERLQEYVKPTETNSFLVPSHAAVADAICKACSPGAANSNLPLIRISGTNTSDQEAVASAACAAMGLQLYVLAAQSLPGSLKDIALLARLWQRTAALNACALLVDATALSVGDKAKMQLTAAFINAVQGTLLLSTSQWEPETARSQIAFEIPKPTTEEQLQLWSENLGSEAGRLNGQLHKLVTHFNLGVKTITNASREVNNASGAQPRDLFHVLWKSCCRHTRPKIDELAQRIEPVADWSNLVLPDQQIKILEEIAIQVKRRHKVYHDWGFNTLGSRGLGISALFTGESGTGKTMAAEVLANNLQLDLYRIDLSQVVNKYIGETEKNLKLVFDAAEEGGAILLFDEADALFGKRSDIKDSHDRYSNIEVSYLLQRMEAYGGLAILTTNMRSAIDKAFLRRIRFVVHFPYPDAVLRSAIWQRIFPRKTPVKDLDYEKLSKLNVAGGNIRNIALNAAFLAADEDGPVDMNHIWRAVKSEYTKLEKPLSNIETGM
jgi:hypothetical protein